MLIKLRRTIASKFGRLEHRFGELLGIILIIQAIIIKEPHHIITAIIWTIYFISHKTEKVVYGKVGFR